MLRIKQAVVVEGKYDKITLENVIDAAIFTTDGFRIFKNKEKCELLRRLALRDGIIIMTDSDAAGAQIRSYLKGICAGGSVINVYIPQLAGKERRKPAPSKQGYLGVEGMTPQVILEALKRSGVTACDTAEPKSRVTKQLLFSLGLSGRENSAAKREALLKYLSLPTGISANAFLDAVNSLYGLEDFTEVFKKWEQEQCKD